MKAIWEQLGVLLVLAGSASAQMSSTVPATLQDIVVSRQGEDTRVEVVLTSPVQATVSAAHHQDRLVLILPATINGMRRSKIQVNATGLRTLRIEEKDGTKTLQVMLELDRAHPYTLTSDNGHITLTLFAISRKRTRAVAAASRGVLRGIFHRDQRGESGTDNTSTGDASAAATPGVFTGEKSQQPSSSSASTGATVVSSATQTAQVSNSSVQVTEAASANAPAAASQQMSTPEFSDMHTAKSASPVPAASSAQVSLDQFPQATRPSQNPSSLPTEANAAPTPNSAGPRDSAPPAKTSGEINDNAKGPSLALRASEPSLRTAFRVKYIAEGVAYLDGGRSSCLKEGMKLEVEDSSLPTRNGTSVSESDPSIVAELEVSAVAETSAVTDIHSAKRPVKVGDIAYLSSADSEALVQERALSPTRKYPAVVSFTTADPQDEEVREQVPRPPLPSVNRARGRIGLDYMGTVGHGSNAFSSSGLGMMFRGDITRIGGTYWNLSGFWRGRFTSQSPQGGQTIQDLINRTYHLSMTYDNPQSSWVAGFGRVYLPWATSLDTIDGGYFGRKISDNATLGIFGGSTPDPTSYDYAPNHEIGGAFLNFTGGDFAKLHYSSTLGGGLNMLHWQPDRPFGFLENTISYAQHLSLYDALQVDSPSGNSVVAAPGPGLSRNFFTFRVQPHPRLELDFNQTYFRDIPTFDPALIGTGLLDKYLFQGFSVGARLEVMKQVSIYTQLGRSSRTGDAKSSLNQLYGITFARLPGYGLRADLHYATFNSSFGSGSYKSVSIGRTFAEQMQVEILTGQQSFDSLMTHQNNSWFVTSRIETNLGSRYFVQGDFTTNRGQMNYDQWMFTLGFRFDSKGMHSQ